MLRISLLPSVFIAWTFCAGGARAGEKKPVPSAEELKAADERIAKDLKEALEGPEKDGMEALLKYAQDHADEPALQFAALNTCLQWGIASGCSPHAGRAGRAMTDAFKGIQFDVFINLMLKAEKEAPQKISYRTLWELYDLLAELARLDDDLETAKAALTRLSSLIGKEEVPQGQEDAIARRLAVIEERMKALRPPSADKPPDQPRKLKRRGGASDGGISDLTEKAIPTREELQALAQAMQKAGKSSVDFSKLVLIPAGQIIARLGADGATWNDSDCQARLKAAASLAGPVIRQMRNVQNAPAFTPTFSSFKNYAANAPSVTVFARRLKSYEAYLRVNSFSGSFAYIPPGFDGEVREFIRNHADQYPDLKSQLVLCDQLRTAFPGDWLDTLKKQLSAEHGAK